MRKQYPKCYGLTTSDQISIIVTNSSPIRIPMRTNPRPAALLLSVATLTGCAVGPDYRSPTIDLSTRFHGSEAIESRDFQSRAGLAQWWAGFDDPLLTRFLSL